MGLEPEDNVRTLAHDDDVLARRKTREQQVQRRRVLDEGRHLGPERRLQETVEILLLVDQKDPVVAPHGRGRAFRVRHLVAVVEGEARGA